MSLVYQILIINLVARVAQYKLEKEHPEVFAKMLEILSWNSWLTKLEKDHPFVECASFADEIKKTGWKALDNFHFIDTPIMKDGFETDVNLQYQNISWAIVPF